MKKILCAIMVGVVSLFSTVSLSVISAEPVGAIEFESGFNLNKGKCEKNLLGLRPWYSGVVGTKDGSDSCVVGSPLEKDMPLFVWTIVLNVLADIFVISGYVALGFVIFGGYKYIMSAGEPGKVAQGKQYIVTAVIGLVISILATTVVNIIINVLAGAAK